MWNCCLYLCYTNDNDNIHHPWEMHEQDFNLILVNLLHIVKGNTFIKSERNNQILPELIEIVFKYYTML